MAERIKWSSGAHATERGSVGGIDLFVINWREKRTGKDWTLTAKLPGFPDWLGEFDRADEAKKTAEDVLVAFVHLLGAKF